MSFNQFVYRSIRELIIPLVLGQWRSVLISMGGFPSLSALRPYRVVRPCTEVLVAKNELYHGARSAGMEPAFRRSSLPSHVCPFCHSIINNRPKCLAKLFLRLFIIGLPHY
jgi:hypothetical protein